MIQIFAGAKELARGAAQHFADCCRQAVAARGNFKVALSGGSTPKLLYQLLSDPEEPFRDQIAWSQIDFYWSDERHVSPDHADSNYRMTNEALLAHVPVAEDRVHRILGEKSNAAAAATAYEETLLETTGQTLPRLDLILLGLGPDGHTASIFPGSEVLQETRRLVAAPWVEKFNTYRITMTLPLLNNGASIVFLVSGPEKARIVSEVLEGPKKYPAQAVEPTGGKLLWLFDEAAASRISTRFNE